MKIIFISLVLLLSFSTPIQAAAETDPDQHAVDRNTEFYDPDDIRGACDSGNAKIQLRGDDNVEQAFNFFIDYMELTPNQSAGIVGNLKAESGVIPGIHQTTRVINSNPIPNVGYGIAQWTPATRQQGLRDYAAKTGPIEELWVELGYIRAELTGKAGVGGDYSSVLAKIKSEESVRGATGVWLNDYEAPEVRDIDGRTGLAGEVLRLYGGGGGADTSGAADCGVAIGNADIIKFNPPLPTSGTIRPTAVVLHWWGSNAAGDRGIKSLVDFLNGNDSCGSAGCSVQLGILKDGKTYQMTRSLTSRAIHATCSNDSAIGIENEGGPADFGSAGPTTRPEQFQAIVATTKFLMDKYSIPLEGTYKNGMFTGVFSHKQVDRLCESGSKPDVDDEYLAAVKSALKEAGAK